mgnify:CR=1 FL=1
MTLPLNGAAGIVLRYVGAWLLLPTKFGRLEENFAAHEAKDDTRFKGVTDQQRDHEEKQGARHIGIVRSLGRIEGKLGIPPPIEEPRP